MATTPLKVWTKQLGTSTGEHASALTTGLDGSIYVSGGNGEALDGQTNSGGNDAFLSKFSADGKKLGPSNLARATSTCRSGSLEC